MGSFSVSCGISHIPIIEGEHVLFLPIRQNKYLRTIPTDHFFCYPDSLYEPALLPIEGFYDSYGRIENIIKNEHTEYLEKKFNNSIEVILSTITEKRDLFSKYDNLSSFWGLTIQRENTMDSFFHLGFELVEEETNSYLYLKKYDLSIFSSAHPFSISDSYTIKQRSIEKKYSFVREGVSFQEFLFKNFNILIGLEDERNEHSLIELMNMGGQFFLKKIYDEMTNISFSESNMIHKLESFKFPIVKEHLLSLGFVKDEKSFSYKDLIFVSKIYDDMIKIIYKNKEYTFFTLDEFLKFFKSKIDLDESKLKNFDFFKSRIISLKSILDKEISDYEELKSTFIEKEKSMDSLARILKRNIESILEKHVFLNRLSFLSTVYIDYIYQIALSFDIEKDYLILNEYIRFNRFKEAMVATNNLFVPSFCGYQFGAKHVSKYLAKITSNFLNKK